jgi:hypothetical protein
MSPPGEILQRTLAAAAAFSLPAFAKADNKSTAKKLKIVCVGGHPDDPKPVAAERLQTGCRG